MPPLTTWLVRHGQSTANAGLPTADAGEAPLTELGRRQAIAAARRVDRRPDLIVVSPFRRARETAAPLIDLWPDVRQESWPIQEVTYLSPVLCEYTTVDTRKPMVADYWRRLDPDYVHGPGAESFAAFIDRLVAFHDRLAALDEDFVVVFGHGQFFRAFTHGLEVGFQATADWMRRYRRVETSTPMVNGETIELGPAAFRRELGPRRL
jgi:broad specificity phosphatase PhoE